MSDTERFYYAVQKHLGGTRSWNELNQMEQYQFIAALNVMIQTCS